VHWGKLINFTAKVSKYSAKREEMKKNLLVKTKLRAVGA
jgi:hypothetical protein